MSDFPAATGSFSERAGFNSSTTEGTLIPAGAANTKGAWVELIASTTRPCNVVQIDVPETSDSNLERVLLDIAVGSAGSESIKIADIFVMHGTQATTRPQSFYVKFPLTIPAGTRIAARIQSTDASSQIRMMLGLFSPSFQSRVGYGSIITYGANTADSGGTQVDPGGVANTKGAWVELTASSEQLKGFYALMASSQGMTDNSYYALDFAIGSAGNEKIIYADMPLHISLIEDVHYPAFFNEITIPAGSRISVRAQSTSTTSPNRLIDVVLYGVR